MLHRARRTAFVGLGKTVRGIANRAHLSALEPELPACVERLVTASEASAKDLTALEACWTGRIEKELAGLKDCLALLIGSDAIFDHPFGNCLARDPEAMMRGQHLRGQGRHNVA